MIEERIDKIPLHTMVRVRDLDDAVGYVYERGVSEDGHTIYGVMFDTSVCPANFVPTKVWHCKREDLGEY